MGRRPDAGLRGPVMKCGNCGLREATNPCPCGLGDRCRAGRVCNACYQAIRRNVAREKAKGVTV